MKTKLFNTLLIAGCLVCTLAHAEPTIIECNAQGTIGPIETDQYKDATDVVLSFEKSQHSDLSIGPGAFKEFTKLRSVTIDEKKIPPPQANKQKPTLSIQAKAFAGCQNLECVDLRVDLVDTLYIGTSAFQGCMLKVANFPRAIRIHKHAFACCPIQKTCLLERCEIDKTSFDVPIHFQQGQTIDHTRYTDTHSHPQDSCRLDGEIHAAEPSSILVEWKNDYGETIYIEKFK